MTTSTDYVGLGPCVQDPAWVKMSSPTPAVSKKRKKPDTKPQSQINKCLNEKRRREQENTYIEELAELIQASIASDMSSLSVKPDKCAILQQTVNQIRRIKAAEGAGEGAVQQGEVSSSKPTLLPSQRLGPLLLEALDGFLFLVSTEGKIEFVSDKVSYFIKFTSEDLTGKSIYNIIHVGDHAKFSSSFMSIGWPSESTSETSRSRSFNCRLLVRPPDDQEETMEEKQQRVSQYENMQISAVLLPPSYLVDKGNSESFEGEGQQCLVCLVRRIPPNERIQGTPVEQFTTKLDTQGTIIALDASGVSPRYSQYINKERIGEQFEDLIAPGDIGKVTGHLGEALHSGQATSQVYRVKVGGDRFIRVQTKSKLFRDTDGTQPEGSFIMATHTIIGPFQEGGASATSDRLLAGTSGNGGSVLDESQGGRPSSTGGVVDDSSVPFGDNGRLRRLLSHGDDSGDLSSADGPNKILKDLLNQKDEDDTQGGGTGSGDSIRFIPHRIPHLESKPNTSSSPAANSRDNNMLRELLNNEDEDNEKKSGDEIWDLLNTPEDKKPDLTSEFRPPQGPPGGPMQTVNSTSSSSTPNTLSSTSSSNPQPLNSSGVPPRPPSRDMLPASNMLRGMKRPSDEPHDGNPNKHQVLGAFETMLGPSPPATSMSPAPVQHGGPPTPHGGPSTPHGPPTPLGGPPTPHGGPPTPLGNSTSGNIGHVGSGSSPNNQGQSKLWEKNKMLASLLAKESPHSNPPRPTTQNVNPESLPQEKLPKILKDKTHPSTTWMPSGPSQSQILTQIFVNGPGQHQNIKSSNVSLNQQHPLGTSTSGNSVPQSNMGSQHSTNAHGRLGVNNIPMNSSVSVPTSHGGMWDIGGNSNVSVAASSVSTKTTTALPSFIDAMPRNPIGDVSSSYSEGGLPSITTAANFLSTQNNADDFLPESILNDIMEMTSTFPASGSTDEVGQPPSISSDDVHRPPTSSYNLIEIQKIKEDLMSDFDTQVAPAVTGPGPLPPYTAVASASSIGNYPPPYTQRTRFPNAGPTGAPGGGTNVVGSMIRSSNQQFSPGSPRPNMTNQRTTFMRQQDMRKRLIQQQQNQVLVPTPSSDVTQPPTSYQNMDDLFNNTIAPNVNVTLQRNVADSQTSPNYNILGNSPIGCGGQISPGQRIPQSPFSPVGQTTSPLPTQQYPNSGQIGSYQAQGSQLSPRLSQGSPAPPSYQTGGQPLPQMSPTGPSTPSTPGVQVPSGQQSPAWSTPSPQQRNSLMAQNPLLNAQLSSYMKTDGSRQFDSGRQFHGGGRSGHLPSIRSMPSPGARQSPYPSMGPPTPGAAGQGDAGPYPPSSPQQGQSSLLYQQQQPQQQYRSCLQRTISAPGQMSENNKWVGDSVNTSQAGGLSASPRMDDSRGNSGNDKESMLKHLLSK
ncbi:nuclear receptor coactivator 1-like isoform X16 [Penaeus japonicus]|uniref:nuclear receptor coactivator 1-like isoform X16 n=1 Tax=Penaeus japonicus TaxID=27405 RepID=UPI001C70B965|nr:nuclear receptor coactivator 1-like isoform X16 [Penaeus japonicus]